MLCDIQNGFRGLRGLQFIWLGLYSPYPMRKYSIGISIACGCSSVTTEPQACTCRDTKLALQRPFGDMKPKQTREHVAVERKPMASQTYKSRPDARPLAGAKLELAKPKVYDDGLDNNRKLEAAKRYQEAENGSWSLF
ncbi:hypothetical protein ZEAMMB73_Zm00001d041546 [Zea mays]|uniref:Uncharacterized protein n=1 Tax=Zea mays TaxID=4577 RepID=A0A1D6MWT8_MAIZE|nr:hypothetical protein ZEAMMB73_Zm00001d041546 [Zea mays]